VIPFSEKKGLGYPNIITPNSMVIPFSEKKIRLSKYHYTELHSDTLFRKIGLGHPDIITPNSTVIPFSEKGDWAIQISLHRTP